MNQLSSIRMFAAVAQCLSFAEAARQLGVSNSVVTRGVALLETHLSVRLVNRTTRHVSMTPAGKQYLSYALDLIKLLDSMDECVADVSRLPAGTLRISASAPFASTDLPHLLAKYRSLQPRIDFELSVFENPSEVDPTAFDVCFNASRRLHDSSLVCKPIARTCDVIVASPGYLAQHPAPRTLEDFEFHDVLLASDTPSRYWEFRDGNGTQRVAVKPVMNLQSTMVLKRAVCSDLGIARLPKSVVAEELSSGILRPLMNEVELLEDQWTVWLLYAGQPHMSLALRTFIDFAADHYRATQVTREKVAEGVYSYSVPQDAGQRKLLWSAL
ncbi:MULTISPECIES: LysR family transcriptional regulator [Paraburkholderia]|uniref:LysR family transcriptional regulator n=1 Tax=Paraburkholderia TaxID=1822464 RepID=UPI001CB001E8|nr:MULTISPECIES: LysR family transcriptional regulator [Paraburkholderia]CAG9222083.1 LysR family transcriptional regulator [Paraburkholderia caribensis]